MSSYRTQNYCKSDTKAHRVSHEDQFLLWFSNSISRCGISNKEELTVVGIHTEVDSFICKRLGASKPHLKFKSSNLESQTTHQSENVIDGIQPSYDQSITFTPQ